MESMNVTGSHLCTLGLGRVKKNMGVETITQLYLTLRDSLAVNTHFDITWSHKVQYQQKMRLKIPRKCQNTKEKFKALQARR